jgi:hypothetical protein
MLAAIKSEAREFGSRRIEPGGGFFGRVLDFFSAFSMDQIYQMHLLKLVT